MRFSFTDEQLAFRSAVADVLSDWCTPADLHARYVELNAEAGRSHARWNALAGLGVTGLVVPEHLGGLGLTDLDLIGIAEEAGVVVLPEPLATTAGVVFGTLGGIPGAEERLAAAVEGLSTATFGGVDFGAERHRVTTMLSEGIASTPRVAHCHADLILLVVVVDGATELHLVDSADVSVDATPALDLTRELGTIHWRPSEGTLLASGTEADRLVEQLVERSALYAAAELLGLCQAMLALTASYVTERKQFGVPVGSFQAVKHHLAGARVRLEFARPAVYRAAYTLANGEPTLAHDVSMAKSLAADAADEAARVSLQCHGAIGYTYEYDLHFAMKRAWGLSAAWGDARSHRARILDLVVESRS